MGGLNTRPITSSWAIDELLALLTLNPAVGNAIVHLVSFLGMQVEVVSASHLLKSIDAETKGDGKTFGAMRVRFKQAVLFGVVSGCQAGEAAVEKSLRRTRGSHQGGRSSHRRASATLSQAGMDAALGQRIVMAPPDSWVVRDSDLLLVVAEVRVGLTPSARRLSATPSPATAVAPPHRPPSPATPPHRPPSPR